MNSKQALIGNLAPKCGRLPFLQLFTLFNVNISKPIFLSKSMFLCLVFSLLLAPWQVVLADKPKRGASAGAKPLCSLSKCNASYQDRLPSIGQEPSGESQRRGQDIKTRIKGKIGGPMWTLLSGEYEVGMGKFDTGMNYKAKWSQDSLKLEVKYRF